MTGIKQNPNIPRVNVAKVGDPEVSPPTRGKYARNAVRPTMKNCFLNFLYLSSIIAWTNEPVIPKIIKATPKNEAFEALYLKASVKGPTIAPKQE